MLCWATTSSPMVGSSRNSTSGECSRAAISSIFIRSPSDSSRTGCDSRCRTPSRLGQFVAGAIEAGGLDAIDLLVQAERFGGRQVPPELVLLAHHQGEAAAIGVFAFPGHVAHHAGRAAGGRNHAGEELQRGGLAGPVGPEEGDEFALFDGQIDAAHGLDDAILPAEQPADRGEQPFLFLINPIGLRQPFDLDDRHSP